MLRSLKLWWLCSLILSSSTLTVLAQQSSSESTETASSSSDASSTSSQRVYTTTVRTTISPTNENAEPTPTSVVLTLPLTSTAQPSATVVAPNSTVTDATTNTTTVISDNSTYPIGTIIYSNSTVLFPNSTRLFPNGSYLLTDGTEMSSNGTILNTAAWDGTQAWLPFHIRIDAAYGVAGAFLIITGVPLALLGGKNRWTSMMIVSGYMTLLFTLVIILRFGVSPNILSTPTPNPPDTTLRGLYALACIIAALIGGGLGVFFYNETKYLVPAMGGFAFGWFIEACKSSGTTGESVIGRWLLLGGLSVVFFIFGLFSIFHYHLLLVSTAFIGATAFVLGIDCFTRAGLKEFYVWNLGFRNGLFPKLWVQPDNQVGKWVFPLLTIMQVEIGVLVAVCLVGTAVQYRFLGKIKVRLDQIRQEDTERRAAEDEARNQARFKEHDEELEKWEGKYGNKKGLDGESLPLPVLGKQQEHAGSTRSLMRPDTVSESRPSNERELDTVRSGRESAMDMSSLRNRQSAGSLPVMDLGDTITVAGEDASVAEKRGTTPMNPDEQERERLMDEIISVRKSIEILRSTTPNSVDALSQLGGAGPMEPRSRTQSGLSFASGLGEVIKRPTSAVPSIRPLPAATAPLKQAADETAQQAQVEKDKEWNDYLAERKLFTPPAGVSPPIASSSAEIRQSSLGRLSKIPDSVMEAIGRRERGMSAYELGTFAHGDQQATSPREEPNVQRFPQLSLYEPARLAPQRKLEHVIVPQQPPLSGQTSHHAGPTITGHADSPVLQSVPSGNAQPPNKRASAIERTVTHEELMSRHRAKLAQLQNPVTETLKEETRLAEAKARYEKQKSVEQKLMEKREAERVKRGSQLQLEEKATSNHPRQSRTDLISVPKQSGLDRAAQWRKSVAMESVPVRDTTTTTTDHSANLQQDRAVGIRENVRTMDLGGNSRRNTQQRTSTLGHLANPGMERDRRGQTHGLNEYVN